MLHLLKINNRDQSWEEYCKTRAYQRRCKETAARISRIDPTTLALTTFDRLYRLELIKVSIQGWAHGYRSDNPYADNYSKYTSASKHAEAVKILVSTVVRYQFEVENQGHPQVSWAVWADKGYRGLQARIA